ncbi:hypothetical protein D9M68_950680 [compost metagenome]
MRLRGRNGSTEPIPSTLNNTAKSLEEVTFTFVVHIHSIRLEPLSTNIILTYFFININEL